ncbi:MAG: CARDB domain-containing protein, partial [Dehalococcoidia bacterium]
LYNWDTSWWQFFEWNIYSNPDLWLRDRPASLPNLTDTTPSGWSYPIVPRSAGDATDTWCPITTTLPGNTLGTYYNWSWTNDGSYNAPAHRTHLYLDGVYSWWSTIGLMNPGYEVKFINQGPNTVRGGRHTLYYDIDVNEEVWETSEADNRWSRQFVWSPYELSDDTSVTRSAPPKKDAWGGAMPRWYNNDGFSFYVHNDHPNKYWSAVGILPGNSASDYSLRLWDIGDYTGSEQGFGVGYLEWSTYGTDVSEFVIVNDNQAAHGTYFAGAINDNEGTANFRIEEATSTKIWPRPGTEWNGPYSPASDNVLDIYECGLGAGEYEFYLDQTSGTCDLGMTLYDDETTHCKKGEHMVGGYADSYGDGADESFTVSIPDSGYHGLAVWKTDSSDYSKSSTYRIYFVRRCDLTIAVDGTGNTNPAPGTYTYDYDTEVTITAIETDPCWEFDHFMVDSTQYNYSPITITITADTNVTAYFTRKPYDLTIGVSGNGTTDPIPGTHIYDCCTWASITAIENDTCWEFDHWSGDASGNSSTVRVHIDGDKSVTANFVYKGSFNLTIGVSGTGTTDPPPGTHTYDCCTMVDVEAIETDPLWQFDHWSGDASGTSPTVKVHIDENKSVTAHFIAKPDLVIEQKWEVEAAPKKYLHPAETPLDPLEPIEKPICPDWHELYPAYCNQYQLSDWEDNGDGVLSPCDNIVLTDKTTGEEVLHHVDEMTVTILVSSEQPEIGEEVPVLQAVEEAYLEFVGGYEEVARAMKEPVCTYWHLVYPEFCPDYHIAGWDDNGDGYLNYCDYILLDDVETGKGWWWHVEEVTWDIIVSPVEPVSPCTYVVWYTVLNQGSDTAEAGHSVTLYVDKNVIEHKVVPVDLTPKGNYTDSFRTVVECTTPGDVIEVCADNYDQVDELDEKNNCLRNEWPCPPSIDVKKKVWDPEEGIWVEEICALLDDVVTFNCTIHNDGCCDLTKILVTDILSESLRYANNATVNGEPWEPTIVEPNEFEWALKDWLLEPCNTIEIEFDAVVVMWSAEPDVNTQMAEAWCDEAGIMVDDQDTAAVQPFCPGDADMDGDVDVFDWVRVRRILMGLDPPTCGADADMDGDIDVFDWVRVRRILMGLEPYPC